MESPAPPEIQTVTEPNMKRTIDLDIEHGERGDVKIKQTYEEEKDENRLSIEGAVIVSAARLNEEVNDEIHNIEIESPTNEVMTKKKPID